MPSKRMDAANTAGGMACTDAVGVTLTVVVGVTLSVTDAERDALTVTEGVTETEVVIDVEGV